MSQLTPCPECHRHIRKTETQCPFCAAAVSLAHVPPPALPRKRLGRAATFAFGASVVGATAFVGCDSDNGGAVAVYGAPPAAGSGGSNGGDAGSTSNGGSFGGGPVYGAPPSGASSGGNAGSTGEAGGAGGADDAGGMGGEARAIYGGPPSGAGGI